jgi:hypothetical protein
MTATTKQSFRRFSILTIPLLLCAPSTALAEAGGFLHDPLFSSERVDQLPTEVRHSVRHMCSKDPSAEQYFATYLDNGRIIKLHFERLTCDGQPIHRDAAGCLHEQFVRAGSHYRLLRTYYDRCDD